MLISFLFMLLLHSSVYIVKFYKTEFVLLCYKISKLVILVSLFLSIKSRRIIPSRSGFLKHNPAGLAIVLLILLAICTFVSVCFASASCTPVSVVLSSISVVSKLVGDEMDPCKVTRTEAGHTGNWPEKICTAIYHGERC